MMKTQNEIIKQGYDALINSLGVADTKLSRLYFSKAFSIYQGLQPPKSATYRRNSLAVDSQRPPKDCYIRLSKTS
ncbi:MAG: hypothetical protein ACYTXY_40695, partial [Nostoc sp.]